jgi:glycosyltransferase involved in cell wall biosynthesis
MSAVDAIVPCYNYGRFLRECVESILEQPVDVRVLIIDDASSDETPEVAADLAARDSRVEVVSHAVNRGNIATYNEGLAWASADYTLLISADDFLVPGSLLRACKLMDEHPDVGFVYGRIFRWHVDEPRPCYQPSPRGGDFIIMPGWQYISMVCAEGPQTVSPEVLVRTCVQRLIGGYRQDLPHWADTMTWLTLASKAKVGYIDDHQACYRIHNTNMHLSCTYLSQLEERRMCLRILFEQLDHGFEGYEQLKSLAFRTVAKYALHIAHYTFERGEIDDCRRLLQFAVDTDPDVRSLALYSRLRWKLALGPRVWSVLRPVLRQAVQARMRITTP